MDAKDINTLSDTASQHGAWRWYAIADSAQDKTLPAALCKDGAQQRCLLDAPDGSPLATKAPHLVQLVNPSAEDRAWKWIARNAPSLPCITVIASTLDFDAVFNHLKPFTEVLLPDGDDMFFAFWDPAILAVLVGQQDDPTLYVKGPVLTTEQKYEFTHNIAGWWYWDREGAIRSVQMNAETSTAQPVDLPLKLTQQQVDDLVEASVPDQLLHHINENQPHLLTDVPPRKRFGYASGMLTAGRGLGLEGMRDLTNFICLGLIYRERFNTEPRINDLLAQVHQKTLTMDDAMKLMPE